MATEAKTKEAAIPSFLQKKKDNVGVLRIVIKPLRNSLTRRHFPASFDSEIQIKMLAEENFGIEVR